MIETGNYGHILMMQGRLMDLEKNAAVKKKIDKIFGDGQKVIERNSENYFIMMLSCRGFINLTLVTVTVTHGNTVAFLLTMHTINESLLINSLK